MPGTPKKQARQVVELERRTVNLVEDLLGRMPKRAHDSSDDPTDSAWREAVRAAAIASLAVAELGQRVRDDVGLSGTSVALAYMDENDDVRSLLPYGALDHLEDGEFEPEPVARVLTSNMPF